ncbi:MAG: hypothetical protein KC621_15105 [Myxococcales bacterium]|nr:hypothetical protein [Myxococcales bacterium]
MLTRQTPTIERPPPAYEPPTLALGPAGAGNAAAQDQLAASMAAEPQQQGLLDGFLDLIGYGPEDLARAKLEDQFVVSDEPVEGERAPNHLTEEEFQEVVELYMAIEAGETDIVIDAEGSDLDPGEFREKVMADLARIMTTKAGRAMLKELAYGTEDGKHFETVIRDLGLDPAEAGTTAEDGAGAVDGTGADAVVSYVPGADADLGFEVVPSDVALFHELVHAHHMVEGKIPGHVDPKTGAVKIEPPPLYTGEKDDLDPAANAEEYATVGLCGRGGRYTENGYREERAQVEGVKAKRRTSYLGTRADTDPYLRECHTREERAHPPK